MSIDTINQADIKKMLINPQPTENLPTQKILLLCKKRIFFVPKNQRKSKETGLEIPFMFILFIMLQHIKFDMKKTKISSKKYKPVHDENFLNQ